MTASARMGALRAVLGVVCASHLAIGLTIMLFGAAGVRLAARMYGVENVPETPAFLYILKPLGAYMLAVAVMAAFAIADPAKHRVVIYGIIALLAVRVAQRLIFGAEIREAFGVSSTHMAVQSLFFAAMAVALWILRPKETGGA
ncbi:MAG: hypothetical protein HYY16_10200 [Planctomycetes bacterium]|nr:hypothetical protein [Planctomycetota bacterium]